MTQDSIPTISPLATYFPHPAHIRRLLSPQFINMEQVLHSYAAAIIQTTSYITQKNIDVHIQNDTIKSLHDIYEIEYRETTKPHFDLISYVLSISKLYKYENVNNDARSNGENTCVNGDGKGGENVGVVEEEDGGEEEALERVSINHNINELKKYLYYHFGGEGDYQLQMLSIKGLKNLEPKEIYIQLIPTTKLSTPTISTVEGLNILHITFNIQTSPIDLSLYILRVWATIKRYNIHVMGSGMILNNKLDTHTITFLREINDNLFTHNLCKKLMYNFYIPPLTPFFIVVPDENNLFEGFKNRKIIRPTNFLIEIQKSETRTKEDVLKAEMQLKGIARYKSEVECLLKGTTYL